MWCIRDNMELIIKANKEKTDYIFITSNEILNLSINHVSASITSRSMNKDIYSDRQR